jgi:hypothetical protein
MKNYILGLIIIVSAFTFYSCNPPGRVYKTIAIDDIISQVPVSLKGKRDLSIQADISFYTPSQTETFSKLLNTDVRYEFNSATALSIASQYAISNQFSLGLKYIGEQDYTGEYTSHNITGTVNFFKNFPTKNKNVQFGYDVLGGFQYKTARNYMTVDEYYLDSTPKPYIPILVFGLSKKNQLSFYRLRQNIYRFFIQPSISVEGENFHFFTGFLIAYQDQFKIYTSLDQQYIEYVKAIDVANPLTYLYNKRGNVRGEYFFGIGAGPEIARPYFKTTILFSPDKFQGNALGFTLGITSNFNLKKSKKTLEISEDL